MKKMTKEKKCKEKKKRKKKKKEKKKEKMIWSKNALGRPLSLSEYSPRRETI